MMKTIKWEKCVQVSMGNYPPIAGKMLMPTDPVEPNMHVTAKYKGLDVHLRIIKETNTGMFYATVMYFEPVSASKPDDLFKDDEVLIDRSSMGCLYAEG